MRTAFSLGKYRGSCRLYCHDLNIRVLFFQILTGSCKSSACADTGYKDIYLSVCVIPDLRTCSCFVCSRVCRVYKLSRNIAVRNLLCKLICFGDSTFHSLGSFCQNQFCTVCLKNVSTFNTHGLRHGKDDSISLRCCDGGKADTCISGGRLNDDRSFLENSPCLSILDHCFGNSVLDTSGRIEVFQFHKNRRLQSKFLLYIGNLYQWSISDQSHCSFINV